MDEKKPEREKAKLPHPDAFLDLLDGDPNQNPDLLLSIMAPNLDKQLNHLTKDFADLKIDIEILDLDGEEPEVQLTLKQKLRKLAKLLRQKSLQFLQRVYYRAKYLLFALIFDAPKKAGHYLKSALQWFKSLFSVFGKWSVKRKLVFGATLAVLAGISYGYFQIVNSRYLYRDKFHFYGSISELAEESFSYDSEMSIEPFYDSPRVKAYLFKLKPLVVNLKRKDPLRDNPMGFFEFVLEGNSGDVVVELKLRESEFIDLTERLIESQSYEFLDTSEGKINLKEELRKELNKKLTEGIIRKVEIQNVFIKP